MTETTHNELKKQREVISELIYSIDTVFLKKNEINIWNVGDRWQEFYKNVHFIKCSLSNENATILNVKFDGGKIPTHQHLDRDIYVYIVDGQLIDSHNEITKKEGDVYKISAGIMHSLESNYALCTITFKPPYQLQEKYVTTNDC